MIGPPAPRFSQATGNATPVARLQAACPYPHSISTGRRVAATVALELIALFCKDMTMTKPAGISGTKRVSAADLKPLHGVAIGFGVAGLGVCGFLGWACWIICCFAGWGDGSSGNAIGAPQLTATLMVLPFCIYFGAGVIAALSTRWWIRILAAIVAHSLLLVLLAVMAAAHSSQILAELAGVYAIVAILFSLSWVRVLSKSRMQTRRLSQPAANEESS